MLQDCSVCDSALVSSRALSAELRRAEYCIALRNVFCDYQSRNFVPSCHLHQALAYKTRVSLFVLGLAILCFVYFLVVVVWLSVPVQSIFLPRDAMLARY